MFLDRGCDRLPSWVARSVVPNGRGWVDGHLAVSHQQLNCFVSELHGERRAYRAEFHVPRHDDKRPLRIMRHLEVRFACVQHHLPQRIRKSD